MQGAAACPFLPGRGGGFSLWELTNPGCEGRSQAILAAPQAFWVVIFLLDGTDIDNSRFAQFVPVLPEKMCTSSRLTFIAKMIYDWIILLYGLVISMSTCTDNAFTSRIQCFGKNSAARNHRIMYMVVSLVSST